MMSSQQLLEQRLESGSEAISLRSLVPSYNERAFIAGRTGSGKTTLTEFILRHYQYVVVFDTKGLIRWQGFEKHTEIATLVRSSHSHLVYSPRWEEFKDKATVEGFFEWVYRRGNTYLYVDEGMSILDIHRMPEFYEAIYFRGRELGTGVITSSQRPTELPQVILSEAEHFYIFQLQLPQDLNKIEGILGKYLPEVRTHEFVYFNKVNPDIEPVKYKLQLQGGI